MSEEEILDPIHPGEILKEDFMDELGLSMNRVARDISVPPNRVSEIIHGVRSITADTALRLERYFGVEAQFWLNLQSEYDLRVARRKTGPEINRRILPIWEDVSLDSAGH